MSYVYITGTDTGFGRILCGLVHKKGMKVFAGCYLEKSMTELKNEYGEGMVPLQVDVSNEASVEKAASFMTTHLEQEPGAQLVGIVNNAGVLCLPGPVEFTPTSAYRKMFDVNVMGTVMTTKSLLPLIRKSRGRIVNVASIAGLVGLPSEPAYCASKFAVEGYSEVLRKDMLPWDVTVSIIEPGVFSKTNLYNNFQTGLDQLWEQLPQNLKDDYGYDHYQFQRKLMGQALGDFGNTNSELVPLAMLTALTTKNPKYRYKVGYDSRFLVPLLQNLPESASDEIMTMTDFRLPYVPPAAAPKNGKSICKSRYGSGNLKYWLMFLLTIVIYRKFLRN